MARVPHDKIYGLAAVRAVFEMRPEDILRISHTRDASKALAPILSGAARLRIPYEERTEEELETIAGAVHHEGVCLAARPRHVLELDDFVHGIAQAHTAVALDAVGNPHNVGAVLRTAAFLGIDGMLVQAQKTVLTPAAVRIAEGGAEHVVLGRCDALGPALHELAAAGAQIVGADMGGTDVRRFAWAPSCVLVLGHEGRGLSADVRAACTHTVSVGGTGVIESLNVSVAAGILLHALATSEARGRKR